MTQPAELIIRAPSPADAPAWRKLWDGYNRFYRAQVPEAATAHTWSQLCADAGAESRQKLHGLVAERNGQLCGLVHFLFHASSWSLAPSCYLEDLFVDPSQRGSGAGAALIEAVADAARAQGAGKLYWHTQEYNAPARSLYDTLAERSSFIVYTKPL